MPTGPAFGRPDDRLIIEPGIPGFPDAQLRVWGLLPGMRSVDCFVAEFIIGAAKGGTRWLLAMTTNAI
jgi:hypothetical protein